MPSKYARFECNPQQKKTHIACNDCDKETVHQVIFTYTMEDTDDPETGPGYFDSYEIVQCQGCREVSFRHYSEICGQRDIDGNQIGDETLYPHRLAGRKELPHLWNSIPIKIIKIYKQTHLAVCSDCPVLAGIGIRAIVEGVCAEKKAKGKSLEDRIESLVTLGVLTTDGAKILHELRHLGNKAAHEVDPPSIDELNAAMDVAEHLLRTVWIIPAKARLLEQERAKKASEKKSTPIPP